MTVETALPALLGLALALYGVSALTAVTGRPRCGWGLMIGAWLVNAGVIILNWLLAGAPPLGNMYHVMVFLAACMLPALLTLTLRDGLGWLLPWFSGASIIPLIGAFTMKEDSVWRRMPALQSDWFVPHVVSYMFSYALCTVAFLIALVILFKKVAIASEENRKRLMAAETSILRLAFPFLTFGMLSGALWAEEAWGKYWSWDVKESWALITWLFYLVYFHCRREKGLKRWAQAVHLAAFAALIITFLVVNLGLINRLTSALHSYT
ncbi:MAG: cytochrome c biogenesis protein CcsA [Planctomycetota bacterium]|jgi:ABC-type transport system involved in cytochrome c biogenesis permease subunit